MVKREAELKSAFAREFRRRAPHFIVLLNASRAAPDRTITGGGKTTWWEFKHATPDFDSPGDQELMCKRLAAHGFCRYVIWWESKDGDGKRTLIVHPKMIEIMAPEDLCEGFDHKWLTNYVLKIHSSR